MPTRKDLKGIAYGLHGSFISRNNDVGGYWGIGKLCLLAVNQSAQEVKINLLDRTMNPPSGELMAMVSGYRDFLLNHLQGRRIEPDKLRSANIVIQFGIEQPKNKMPSKTEYGSLFRLSVYLEDDRGKLFIADGYGYCRPHDPDNELKSAR